MIAKFEGTGDRPTAQVDIPNGSAAMPGIIEWLAGDECHELDDAGLAAGIGRWLRAAGLPIDHLTLHLRTLHPEILGRTVAWAPNDPVRSETNTSELQ